ncbi:hypothetical protein LF1_38660 [Rubripirellula obstinata]|uniref:Uncharacterized protein n=1 Tax=Rubripirellula obstinata TaxID=406547 RepID=A0A5B1CNF0_9BACT|nr:hypothetical protein [Rubripirellula obstinata]KAA1261319.1 hypothetical protein LF1_38660 [Rubripirellula obstinata]
MKHLLLAFGTLFVAVSLVGCGGDSEPSMVADPNEYAPYQASAEEIQAQQSQTSRPTNRP